MTGQPPRRQLPIERLILENWRHPATTGEEPGYWREAASKSYVIRVGGMDLRLYHRDLLRDYDGQVALFRAWLDALPIPSDDESPT